MTRAHRPATVVAETPDYINCSQPVVVWRSFTDDAGINPLPQDELSPAEARETEVGRHSGLIDRESVARAQPSILSD